MSTTTTTRPARHRAAGRARLFTFGPLLVESRDASGMVETAAWYFGGEHRA